MFGLEPLKATKVTQCGAIWCDLSGGLVCPDHARSCSSAMRRPARNNHALRRKLVAAFHTFPTYAAQVCFRPIADISRLPDTPMVSRLLLLLSTLLLTSCDNRPATREYFTSVTGLPLCSGASVRNVNADAAGRSPGFDSIYIVDVTMPATCMARLAKAVGQRIGAQCKPSEHCSGNAKNGDFYGIEPIPVGFRVTHST